MTQVIEYAPYGLVDEPVYGLPADILTHRAELIESLVSAEEVKKQADGLIGPIGLDGILGLLPGLGALYTFYTMLRLQGCAARARCSVGTRLSGFVIGVVDVVVGVFVGPGDLVDFFLRSSAIFAGSIRDEIRGKLVLIETVEQAGHRRGQLSSADITHLRDQLFRGGKTEQGAAIRAGVLLLIAGFILYSCVG